MIIGSAGDTGTNRSVDMYVDILRELADEHKLEAFRVVYFYSEVDKECLHTKLQGGETIAGLDGRDDLTSEDVNATDRIVAVAGIHPYLKALQMGADVIIGGRSSDAAVFAAPAIYRGFPEAESYFLGKVLECASFCAEPYGAKESVLGTITNEDVRVTAMHPEQRCTIASVAGHAMYERSNPYYEYVAGGMLDMTNCQYEQFDERTTRVTGADFVPVSGRMRVKLEGAGKLGERYIGIAGIRDPYTIKNIDKVIEWAQQQASEQLSGREYQLYYHVFGKNGVMGEWESVNEITSHELGIVVEAVAGSDELAKEAAVIGARQLFYARLPDVKGTAGSAAFIIDEVLKTSAAYEWTMNHVVEVDDALELFEVHESTV